MQLSKFCWRRSKRWTLSNSNYQLVNFWYETLQTKVSYGYSSRRVANPSEKGNQDGRGNTEDFDFWFDFLYFFCLFVCFGSTVSIYLWEVVLMPAAWKRWRCLKGKWATGAQWHLGRVKGRYSRHCQKRINKYKMQLRRRRRRSRRCCHLAPSIAVEFWNDQCRESIKFSFVDR